mgnify:CR=1 FL=1
MFPLFIARRYLRAKRKQVMISVITAISVIGVAAGVMALVIRAELAGWSRDGNVRQAAYKGLEPGRDPRDITRERPEETARLVAEAEALVPASDPKAARASLRTLQERWDATGDVPRADRERLETRLRRVDLAHPHDRAAARQR